MTKNIAQHRTEICKLHAKLRREKQRADEITYYRSSSRIKDIENPGFMHLSYLFAYTVDFITCSHENILCFSTYQNGNFILPIMSVFYSSIHLFTYLRILSTLSCCLQAICQTLEQTLSLPVKNFPSSQEDGDKRGCGEWFNEEIHREEAAETWNGIMIQRLQSDGSNRMSPVGPSFMYPGRKERTMT